MNAGTDAGGDASEDLYAEAAAARERWRRSDDLLNRARLVREELLAFGDAVDWIGHGVDDLSAGSSILADLDSTERAAWEAVEDALERFQLESDEPRDALAFLVESGEDSEPAPLTAFSTEHTVDATVGALVDALETYADGGPWDAVPAALAAVPAGPEPVRDAAELFEAVAVAALHDRVAQRSRVQDAIDAATEAVYDPVTTLEEQPIALFPVGIETRFVGPADTTSAEEDELWIRLYHDDVHAHTHEFELTTEERRSGKRFWATMWLAAHPDPDEIEFDAEGTYLTERFPNDPGLREMLAGIDLDRFSSTHDARYDELKSRAWGTLVDRLGEDRADYVVHALAPTDHDGTDLEYALLTPPELGLPDLDAKSAVPDEVDRSPPETDGEYPGLAFPETPLRSQPWTKQPIAKLLPDRWVALLEWERPDGETGRKTIAGEPIEDLLPIGPRAELEGDGGGPDDPDGSEWTEEIEAAFEVGMALRVPLAALPGYDDARGIDRLVVVGAKASMAPGSTAEALTDQLRSHQYTSGLSLLSPGTETNVESADPVGALDEDPEAIGPPRVAEMDLSDGDLLARALALDTSDGHPFAHVPGADSTDQLDARHANSALWPATLGYTLTNVLTPNELIGLESIWDGASNPVPGFDDGETDPAEALAWLDAYRRHFIRYVRARGPFPTLRVGSQPYGLLPVTATHDTETAVPAPDPNVVSAIKNRALTVPEATDQGVRMASLVQAQELSTEELLEADAEPEALYEHDVDPVELLEGGVEATTMRELGENVEELADRGAELSQLVTAGFEVVELESVGATIREVIEAGAKPQQIARAGATVAQLAGVDIPAEELVRAGFTARDVVSAGFTVADVLRGGAPPSALADVGLDRDTLRRLEAPAGSLRVAGVSAADLLEAGYTASELLNGGFAEEELANTGISLADVADVGRSVAELANEGVTVDGLRERGFGPDALLESGYGPDALLEAGYTVGELLDAEESVDALVDAGADLGALKAADVSVAALVDAGADLETLREAGTGAMELAETGLEPEELADAGYTPAELEAAGLPAEPARPEADAEADAADVPSVRTVEVTEPVGKAERDLYAFGFDPATSRTLTLGGVGEAGGANYLLHTGREPTGAQTTGTKTLADETDPVEPTVDPDGLLDGDHVHDRDEIDPAIVDAARSADELESAVGESTMAGSIGGETIVDVPQGVIDGDLVVRRPTPTDDRVADRIESLVTSLRPLWSEAADDLSFASGADDWSVLDALEREAVSRAARVDARVAPQHSADNAGALRAFLTERDLHQFDPRLAHLPLQQVDDGPLLEPHEIVDADVDVFLSILRAESIEDLWTLSYEADLSLFRRSSTNGTGSTTIDSSGFSGSLADAWGTLLPGSRRAALYAALEEADDPVGLLDAVLTDPAGAGPAGEKLETAADFAASYGDAGVHRSLARVLLQHGLVREYLEARARLGIAFDDPPARPFDFLHFSNPALTTYVTAYDDLIQPTVPDPIVDAVYGTSFTQSGDDGDDDIPTVDVGERDLTNAESIDRTDLDEVTFTYDDVDADEEPEGDRRTDGGSEGGGNDSADGGGTDRSGMTVSFGVPELDAAAVDTKASSHSLAKTGALADAAKSVDATGDTDDAIKADDTARHTATQSAWPAGSEELTYGEHVPAEPLLADLSYRDPSYADVLRTIAADDATTTGLDPRLSEFTDSLAHVQTVEPASLATLIGETLDLASHRLDAWWTSLATKRLFELREHQRLGTEAFDAWDVEGYDPDEILAGLDPSLAGALELEVDAGGDEGDGSDADDPSEIDGFGAELAEGAEPGIYVGGYGVVHDLCPTPEETPTYVHAPSVQQAETAALLRSGYLAGEDDEGANLLDVDLSAERVQDARWLLQGVRRGQSLGELLGYRFERRLHEETVSATGENLMQYRKPLREAFPAVLGSLEYTDSPIDPEEAARRAELAKSDVVDGYQLVRHWHEAYPFGYGSALPDDGDDDADPAYVALEAIVEELRDDVDAVSDLLIAESVHQLGKGDADRAGLSLEALSTGAHLPEPEVTALPRSETGLTHRGLVVLEADESDPDGAEPHLRAVAEPALESWASSLLPESEDVGCRVVYEWTEGEDGSDPAGEPVFHETTTTMAVLDLSALDVLALAQDAEREGQSELERRFAYRLRRDRPADVPPDASVSLTLTDPGDAAISVAALIEAARSLASLIDAGRPADGVDLVHPADPADPGFDETSVDAIEARATAVETTLTALEATLIDRVTPLGVDAETLLAGSSEEPAGETGTETGDESTDAGDVDPIDEEAALTTRADAVGEALDSVADDGVLAAVEEATTALETADVSGALEALADELPAGVTDAANARETHLVVAEADQELVGAIGHVPRPPKGSRGDDDAAEAGDGSESDGGDGSGDGGGSGDVGGDSGDGGDDGNGGSDGGDGSSDDDGGDGDGGVRYRTVELLDPGIGVPEWVLSEAAEADESDALEGSLFELDAVARPSIDPDALAGRPIDPTGGSGDDEGVDDADSADDADAADDAEDEDPDDGTDDSVDPVIPTVDVYVWGVSGTTPFARVTTADVDAGRFATTVDFDDLEPGAPFSVVAVAGGTIVYSAAGRVLATGDEPAPDPAGAVDDARDSLGALCWLAAVRESLSLEDDAPTLAELEAAIEALDLEAVAAEAAVIETNSPVLTDADRDAVGALAALDAVELAAVVDACWDLIDVAVALGLDAAFDVFGSSGGHASARIEPVPGFEGVGDVRRRLRRVAADAAVLRSSAPPRALAFDQPVGHLVAETVEPTVTARTIDALVNAPPWLVGALADVVDRPTLTLARLQAWVFDADGFASLAASGFEADGDEGGAASGGEPNHLAALADDLASIAGAVDDLETLFAGVAETEPTAAAGDALIELADELDELAASLDDPSDLADWGAGTGPNPIDATETITDDAAVATEAVSADRALLEAARDADGATALRRAVLEGLREPLLAASFAGFYGSVPAAPVGDAREDERTLRTQATTLLVELDERLTDAAGLDPTHPSYPTDRPLPQRVEDGRERLAILLDDEVPILVPFGPPNGGELARTFAETAPPASAGPLAVERWFQRVSRVRSRPAKLRDALSYAEALTGEFARELTVGQLPFRSEDDWMGADGVEVERGRLSLVAQFGPGVEPADVGGRVTALFVDEWVETVPAETERTGLAIQCDDPGNRPPQSILLAVPPEDEEWSLGALFGAVTETMAYAQYRSVDLDDLAAVEGARSLLPGLYFPNDGQERPVTPSVNFDVIDWYDRSTDPLLLPRHVYETTTVLEEVQFIADSLEADDAGDSR
ncbi:hypothetical protein [Natronobeatus ordinarius]|uniref:hypothetical protein n=1 Tax=Natronobeatus ordinarius TaxID=2963433 RepID=UPI0020CE3C47|nr:hypothetical protein [Natronobeatus ordinarius]